MKRYISVLLFLCIFFTGCDQEPLFWDIVHEYPPIRPVINGSPSRIVSIIYSPNPNPVLYVSNGDVWECDTNNPDLVWEKMPLQPEGKIKTLAATENYLFSLDWDGNIKKWDGTGWPELSVPVKGTEQIFGAKESLFAGALTGTSGASNGYCIMAMSEASTSMAVIKSDTGLLFGAVHDGSSNYFIGTRGNGIYITNSPTNQLTAANLASVSDSNVIPSELSIAGLIEHNGKIVAVTTKRQIIYYNSSAFDIFASPSVDFSGAMASWEYNGNHLLLLGLLSKSGSFGYGYRELIWKSGEDFTTNKQLYVPGEKEISSVEQGSQYTSAIGNYGISALFVPPADIMNSGDDQGRPVVYASTIRSGLWSYRKRGGRVQWNGEDNSK